MSDARIHYLITRLLEGSCTQAEKEELADWVNQAEGDASLKEVLERAWEQYEPDATIKEAADPALNRISGRLFSQPPPQTRPFRLITKYAAAAAILLAVGTGIYYWLGNGQQQPPQQTTAIATQDVLPGGNRATLTLSNGQQILLDSASDGMLAQQGGASISKQAGGQIIYNSNGDNAGEPVYNTMSTPRGGAYQLSLPDGTKAWLNAASSITFPTTFTGRERSVSITGEVYLEVARDKTKPFFVKAGGTRLEVLGTHFNVNAYGDEKTVKTTLLEGSVKVHTGAGSRVIAPGEQAQTTEEGRLTVKTGVDLSATMAWKNGRFVFEGAPIKTVMHQLARWYDVEVEAGDDVDELFFADVPRNKKLSDVLKALELTGKVKFRIEGKKIRVMK